MNKKTLDISDHLLAKFLDGKTDTFETERVLEYLNKEKEHLEDFMNIRSAIQIDTDPPIEIDLSERLDFVKQQIESSNSGKKTIKKRFYLISSIAAAAMVIGVISLIFFIDTNKDTYFAENQKNYKDNTPIHQDNVSEQVISTNLNDKELVSNEMQNKNRPVIIPTEIEQEEETEIPIQIQQYNTAAKIIEGNLFEVVKPAKTPYIILCKNLNKTFDFQWKTNAEKIEVVLKDRAGKILLAKDISQTGLQLKYEEYFKYLEIYWELKATFQDGTTEEKFGILQLLVD